LDVRAFNALENIDCFDPRLFNISPKEADQMDPQHRQIVMASYEALEKAGYAPGATPTLRKERIAVFFGASTDEYVSYFNFHL
jgi:acyl transferase domain-containing protein